MNPVYTLESGLPKADCKVALRACFTLSGNARKRCVKGVHKAGHGGATLVGGSSGYPGYHPAHLPLVHPPVTPSTYMARVEFDRCTGEEGALEGPGSLLP